MLKFSSKNHQWIHFNFYHTMLYGQQSVTRVWALCTVEWLMHTEWQERWWLAINGSITTA